MTGTHYTCLFLSFYTLKNTINLCVVEIVENICNNLVENKDNYIRGMYTFKGELYMFAL